MVESAGQSASARSSALLWLAIAPVAALPFETSWVSSVVREASCCIVCAPCTSRPSKVGSERVSSAVTLLVDESAGARYSSVRFAWTDLPWMLAASPRMNPRNPLRVAGLSASNTWSRPTSE